MIDRSSESAMGDGVTFSAYCGEQTLLRLHIVLKTRTEEYVGSQVEGYLQRLSQPKQEVHSMSK